MRKRRLRSNQEWRVRLSGREIAGTPENPVFSPSLQNSRFAFRPGFRDLQLHEMSVAELERYFDELTLLVMFEGSKQ
jgi:hypothetical protein